MSIKDNITATAEDKTRAQAGKVEALQERKIAEGNPAVKDPKKQTMIDLDPDYYKKIEDYWIQEAGNRFGINGPLALSPFDIELIKELDEKLVPLWIIIEGIDLSISTYIQNFGRREHPPLTYCRRAIFRRYKEWMQAQVGKRPDEIRRV